MHARQKEIRIQHKDNMDMKIKDKQQYGYEGINMFH